MVLQIDVHQINWHHHIQAMLDNHNNGTVYMANHLLQIAPISLPIFIIMLGGYIANKVYDFDHTASTSLARLLFYIIMPITLFFDISQLPISQVLIWDYMLTYFLASVCIITISVLLSKYSFKRTLPNIIINAMASTHANTAYIALPLFLILFKTIVPVASIILVQVIFNFIILFGLDVSTNHSGRPADPYTPFFVLINNPILMGTLLGLIFSYFQIGLPHAILSTLSIVSQSASFIALFALGLSLGSSKFKLNKQQKLEISSLIFLKTLLHPIAACLIGYYVFNLSGFLLTAVTLMAAMPTAKNLFIFSERYQVGLERANSIILVTTILSIVTINSILFLSDLL